MNIQTIINCTFILAGAIIILIGIVLAKKLMKALPFIPERQQKHIKRNLLLHRGLMICFFFGYLVVSGSIAFQYSVISETFVSIIFLLGAIFVFIGISVQSSLLSEVQKTLQGVLPICAKCKKVKSADGNPEDQTAWRGIEDYISRKTDMAFSHGYCPKCYDEEMKKIDMLEGKA